MPDFSPKEQKVGALARGFCRSYECSWHSTRRQEGGKGGTRVLSNTPAATNASKCHLSFPGSTTRTRPCECFFFFFSPPSLSLTLKPREKVAQERMRAGVGRVEMNEASL